MDIGKPFFTSLSTAPRHPLRNDRGKTARLVDGELGGARNVDLHVNYLAPDSGAGPSHYHERAENVYIVLSGMIEVAVDGDVIVLGAEDVLFIPPRVVHSTSNPGTETAIFIEVYAPVGHDFHIVDEAEVE